MRWRSCWADVVRIARRTSVSAAGGTTEQIKLGQKYHQYGAANTEMTRRIDEEVARFRRTMRRYWQSGEGAYWNQYR